MPRRRPAASPPLPAFSPRQLHVSLVRQRQPRRLGHRQLQHLRLRQRRPLHRSPDGHDRTPRPPSPGNGHTYGFYSVATDKVGKRAADTLGRTASPRQPARFPRPPPTLVDPIQHPADQAVPLGASVTSPALARGRGLKTFTILQWRIDLIGTPVTVPVTAGVAERELHRFPPNTPAATTRLKPPTAERRTSPARPTQPTP